jgi:hypothetical protein
LKPDATTIHDTFLLVFEEIVNVPYHNFGYTVFILIHKDILLMFLK